MKKRRHIQRRQMYNLETCQIMKKLFVTEQLFYAHLLIYTQINYLNLLKFFVL